MYLRNWSCNGMLYEYKLVVPHENVPLWNTCSVKKASKIRNIYISYLDGVESDTLEKYFDTNFENPAKAVLDKLCINGSLNSEEWKLYSDYALSQFVRTIWFYHWIRTLAEKSMPEIIKEVGENLSQLKEIPHKAPNAIDNYLPVSVKRTGNKPDPDHEEIEISTVIGKGLWFLSIQNILHEGSRIREAFRTLEWSIATAPNNTVWPTSDNPVAICKRQGNQFSMIGPSDAFPVIGNVIIFPLSPTKVLIGETQRTFPNIFQADQDIAYQNTS